MLSIVASLVLAQAPTKLVPVYSDAVAFLPAVGERMRLAALWTDELDLDRLSQAGASAVFFRTDPWGAPDAGGQLESISTLSAMAANRGFHVGLSLYTTYPSETEASLVGEGSVSLSGATQRAWSPWHPDRLRWSANKMGIANRKAPGLSAVGIGVHGEFGNAGFFTGAVRQSEAASELYKLRTGSDAPSPDWWCGDGFAKASWSKRLIDKYGAVEKAFLEWGMDAQPDGLPMPTGPNFPYAARLEFGAWYRSGISSLVSRLSDIGFEIFKGKQVMIPIGPPTDYPQLGVDPYLIATSLSGSACIQATSLCFYDFATNWVISLGRIRSAATASGKLIWAETGSATQRGMDQAWFEAIALGARGLGIWPEQLMSQRDSPRFIEASEPRCDVAVLYPSSTHMLRPQQPFPPLYFRAATELRDYLDFDVLDESALMAGSLSKYRVAVLMEGSIWQSRALHAMREWVEAGGVLVAYDFGKMTDAQGSNAIFQDMFGFASRLSPIDSNVRWNGVVPPSYTVSIGDRSAETLLSGRWGATTAAGRNVESGGEITVPIRAQSDATITFSFAEPPQPVQLVNVSINGRKQAAFTVSRDATRFQIVLDRSLAASSVAVLGFSGIPEGVSLELTELAVVLDPAAPPSKLLGGLESPITVENVRQWVRPYSKGLCVFMPGKKELWREYIATVRHLVYRLSRVSEGRKDARNVDDTRDGVFTCDLGDQVALFNGTNQVQRVSGIVEQEVASNSLAIVPLGLPATTLVLECEQFESTGEAEVSSVGGETALHVPSQNPIATGFTIAQSGRYKVFIRALRNTKPAQVSVSIGETALVSNAQPVPRSEFAFLGELTLGSGAHRLIMKSDLEFKGYEVVITNERGIAGFRVARS